MPDQTAKTVVHSLLDGFISRMGCPKIIHTDQGRQFESEMFQGLCEVLQIQKTCTAPYHPQSNGQVERANKLRQNNMHSLHT